MWRLPGGLERWFGLKAARTTVRREVLGGSTTFATMAYIIVLNPAILAHAGIPPGPSTVATILTAVFGTLLMGLYANRPLAVAPYMGENAFIAFGLAALGIGWQLRLGAVFVSGVAFLVITLLGVRVWLANAISPSLKHSFAVGIGLFLAFIGLYETGIVTSGAEHLPAAALLAPGGEFLGRPDVPVKIGDLHQPRVLLAVFGFVVIAVLMCWRVRAAILIGIVLTGIAGYLLGQAKLPEAVVALPFTGAYDLRPIFLKLDIRGALRLSFLPILLTLFLMSFLDTLGTLVGVGAAGEMLDEQGNFPRMERPMLVDALACVFSSLVGSSTSGAFIESATGVRAGARTGLAAVVTALLFAVSLFFIPLVAPLQELAYAYGPALIAVGVLMIGSVTKIDFADLTEAVPAFATIVMILFTYNIANGLTAGLVLYPLLKLLAGRWRDLRLGSVVLALACLVYYIFGLPH
ncbi:MAG TPA: NCS2 family permease [Gemmataceae bacterium]|nr:NCS2 family permease [Gemmataceae bacterium]